MSIQKYYPWNWLQHEDEAANDSYLQSSSTIQSFRPKLSSLVIRKPSFSNELNQLTKKKRRIFEDTCNPSIFPVSAREQLDRLSSLDSHFSARVNISSQDKYYEISLEAPGLEKDDLSIEIKNHALILYGEKKHEEKIQDINHHFYRIERRYGAFKRVLAIPSDVLLENLYTNMAQGVLTIRIPRKENLKARAQKTKVKQ